MRKLLCVDNELSETNREKSKGYSVLLSCKRKELSVYLSVLTQRTPLNRYWRTGITGCLWGEDVVARGKMEGKLSHVYSVVPFEFYAMSIYYHSEKLKLKIMNASLWKQQPSSLSFCNCVYPPWLCSFRLFRPPLLDCGFSGKKVTAESPLCSLEHPAPHLVLSGKSLKVCPFTALN